ncbi:NADH dehydrogenase 17.8K chain [Lasiosphaeria hispida]|uniref:NADH dehydrogenase 17.8K chain n=1 Tax=Lasiosphaeria hispida TaxID=260671 RepID=A0AAJ0MJP3_9PEZI|nr:NADH dehydrogenase 17.8K chain [Lasiosphaeria hispida]
MSALRQRVASAARKGRPAGVRNTRTYASESHGHGDHAHHAHQVSESFGPGFYLGFGVIPASYIVYQLSRPNKDGEPTVIEQWLTKVSDVKEELARKNHNTTAMIQQAAEDRHLFTSVGKPGHYELRYPEVFQHGSPTNVPAGHNINLDKVIAHYRKQHLDEEERKVKKLVAAE